MTPDPRMLNDLWENDYYAVKAFRLGDERALTSLGGWAAIIRPWPWAGAAADYAGEYPPLPPSTKGVPRWPAVAAHAGRIALSDLVMWAARCGPDADAQTCFDGLFNRALIFDALAAFINDDGPNDRVVEMALDWVEPGHILWLESQGIQVAVMALKPGCVEPGTEPVPGEWT